MPDLQTMFYAGSTAYCTVFEASFYHDDHSYSSAMSAGNGGAAQVPLGNSNSSSTRTPRRPTPSNANNNNGADDSVRSGASSSTNALVNGIVASTNASIVSTSIAGLVAASKPAFSTPINTAQSSSFDRGNSIQELKKSLTLDFTNPESAKKSLQTQTPELLSFLRLTSPELEKFLTQGFAQGVSVVQTPTPTQFFFPKNVTTEQEQYARGFLDALNQIYQRSGFIPVNNILSPGFVANTVAQEAKEGGGKEHGGASSVFPGPSTSNVSFNAALVSNLLAAISTPTLGNGSEPTFITAVSSSGAQQIRQTLAATLAASSSIVPQHSTAFYAINPRSVTFPNSLSSNNVLPNIPISAPIVVNESTICNNNNNSVPSILKSEPDERCTPSPNTYESRSSSVGSSYRDQNSNYGAGGSGSDQAAAAAALATMNRNGGAHHLHHHHYVQNFPAGGAGASSYMQSTSTQQQFLALTNAAQLLIGGHSSQQFDHNLSSTASASSTASSVSDVSTKMEISDDQQSLPGGRYLPGTMPLQPAEQEKLKLERKRARNRQAATKCRKRKIERIQTLEGEVSQLEDNIQNLGDRRDGLLDELQELRKLIEEHQRAKCNIVVPLPSSSSSSSSHFPTTGNLINGTK